eukprot:3123015-Alexandrium_andersonii.AAC.1
MAPRRLQQGRPWAARCPLPAGRRSGRERTTIATGSLLRRRPLRPSVWPRRGRNWRGPEEGAALG